LDAGPFARGFQTFDPPPVLTSLMRRVLLVHTSAAHSGSVSALLALLGAVVAGGAERLQVCFVPEQGRVPMVRRAMIADEARGIAFDAAAHTAGEEISRQNSPA
jgi:hypothetical protein